jgi:hypothetical protein
MPWYLCAVPPEPVEDEPPPEAWLTGPLFFTSAATPPQGAVYLEPYLMFVSRFGTYDSHGHAHTTPHFYTLSPYLYMQIGLTNRWELDLQPQLITQWTQGQSATNFGDLLTYLAYQLIPPDPKNQHKHPFVKVFIHNHWPTGKHQKLRPEKLGTDGGGEGFIATGLGFSAGHIFHFGCYRFLNLGLSGTYLFPGSTRVSGFNTYGGGFGTRGRVHVGYNLSLDLGLEYEWARHWAFAMDLIATWNGRIRFSGHAGHDATGARALIGNPSSASYSIAPALEYNWSAKLGLIAGPWWSFAGRNSNQFLGGLIALSMVF